MGDSYLAGHPFTQLDRRVSASSPLPGTSARPLTADWQTLCLEEKAFHHTLTFERRRAERSRSPFFLMLLDGRGKRDVGRKALEPLIPVLASALRQTDLLGWYEDGSIFGIIFTEVGSDEQDTISEALRAKTEVILQKTLGREQAHEIRISLHVFPENWDPKQPDWSADQKLYPDVHPTAPRKRATLAIKRAIDIAGSGALLILLSPLLFIIALLIKVTSKGPVLFAQERLGQFGSRFKCLKFRSMYTNCDPQIHQEYIQQFIAGKAEDSAQDSGKPTVYKITKDPRITPIGRFLRKTSLDELPQFWNVFRGEMSLVGPRPPVPYEFEIYDIWHRRRVLEVRPGVTGLWQVSGRSRMQFDDMVRLDLRYCQTWSIWLDLKILLATPRAVFSGDGAY